MSKVQTVEEIEERIKKTHLDCDDCRNWQRICELKEAKAHQAGREEERERIKKAVEILRDQVQRETGAFKYDFCFDAVLQALTSNQDTK